MTPDRAPLTDVKPSEKACAKARHAYLFEPCGTPLGSMRNALTAAYAADAVVPRAMLDREHIMRVRAETAERSLSEARAEIARLREALTLALPHIERARLAETCAEQKSKGSAGSACFVAHNALAASNGATDAQSRKARADVRGGEPEWKGYQRYRVRVQKHVETKRWRILGWWLALRSR